MTSNDVRHADLRGSRKRIRVIEMRLGSPSPSARLGMTQLPTARCYLGGHGVKVAPMGSSFGQLFRITTWGESHGGAVGVVIDGCPPRLELSEEDIQRELDRRRPGQSEIVTQRDEADRCRILSGVFEGRTLGTPISILVKNKDARPEAYSEMKAAFRPSHADFTYEAKYGIRNWQGGGRASARETVGRVAAGAVAKKLLSKLSAARFEIVAYVTQIHEVTARIDRTSVQADAVERSAVRCPDEAAAELMTALIQSVRAEGDSVGGVIECVIRGIPAGLGEPVFDKLEADLAKAMLSLPASKGFEIGSGFAATRMKGSEHNDPFEVRDEKVRTTTNNSGGVQGGITNGEDIFFRVAFKPTSTIARDQKTVTAVAARKRRWPRAAATIPVSCRAPCRSSKRWPRWCSAITLCGSGRFRISETGYRTGKLPAILRAMPILSFRNPVSAIRQYSFPQSKSAIRNRRLAALADGFHFLRGHSDSFGDHSRMAPGDYAAARARRRHHRRLCRRFFRWRSVGAASPADGDHAGHRPFRGGWCDPRRSWFMPSLRARRGSL